MATNLNPTPPPIRTPLARLREILADLEVEVEHRRPVEEGEIEVLYISLGTDEQGRPLRLHAFLLGDMLETAGLPGDSDIALLMLQVDLPLKVAATTRGLDIDTSLNLLNQFSFIGTFSHHPDQQAIVFKYTLPNSDTNFDGRVMFETLWSMRLFLIDLIEPLSRLASGEWDAAAFKRYLEEDLGLELPEVLAPSPQANG